MILHQFDDYNQTVDKFALGKKGLDHLYVDHDLHYQRQSLNTVSTAKTLELRTMG